MLSCCFLLVRGNSRTFCGICFPFFVSVAFLSAVFQQRLAVLYKDSDAVQIGRLVLVCWQQYGGRMVYYRVALLLSTAVVYEPVRFLLGVASFILQFC